MKTSGAAQLKRRLLRFLEVHNNTRIVDDSDGALKMYIALARNNRNSKIKDKIINHHLKNLELRLLSGRELSAKDEIVCEFLLDSISEYYSDLRPS
ncbi:MAG: hypothetical protein H7A21_08140 [Spirochaetales bacterium]|nr:hypothetical protein [Leptospiraceae bacterium]MCP5481384.1 hypothetical protein [Spirochaetales bacterium]MCP5486070.1 hypothetical protein [Spirochaetales bacterium]